MPKPLIVYVSGAPGSGKTTLATRLSDLLYIPRISSDLVHNGVRTTLGEPNDRYKSFHEVFVPLMIDMVQKQVSFVVDHVLQKDTSKIDVIDKIRPYADIVIIYTTSADPIKRHLERELRHDSPGKIREDEEIISRAEFHRQNLANTQDADPNLGLPSLTVNTDSDYEPSMDAILAFIASSRDTLPTVDLK